MAWARLIIALTWLRIGLQQSGMAMPSSLLISSDSERQMCRAFLMIKVILLLACGLRIRLIVGMVVESALG